MLNLALVRKPCIQYSWFTDMAVYTCTYYVDLKQIVVGSLLFLISKLIVSYFYRRWTLCVVNKERNIAMTVSIGFFSRHFSVLLVDFLLHLELLSRCSV